MGDERHALHGQLQMVLAGHPTGHCLAAQIDSLSATIGFAADDLAQADRLVDAITRDLKTTIRRNWTYVREVRATTSRKAGCA